LVPALESFRDNSESEIRGEEKLPVFRLPILESSSFKFSGKYRQQVIEAMEKLGYVFDNGTIDKLANRIDEKKIVTPTTTTNTSLTIPASEKPFDAKEYEAEIEKKHGKLSHKNSFLLGDSYGTGPNNSFMEAQVFTETYPPLWQWMPYLVDSSYTYNKDNFGISDRQMLITFPLHKKDDVIKRMNDFGYKQLSAEEFEKLSKESELLKKLNQK
jgi:hypothetical protein